MSDWQPQVVMIDKVIHHPDADALDIVTVLGDYPVITKRNEYTVGDRSAYIPIDTIVPDTEQFHFLCPLLKEKYEELEGADFVTKEKVIGPKHPVGEVPEKYRRIKAKKIRGTYSQGMLIKLCHGCDGTGVINIAGNPCFCMDCPDFNIHAKAGDSIVEFLGLKKWEEEEEENLPGLKKANAGAESPPKGWSIPHYDIDSIRKYISCLGDNEEIVLTEKLHGSNAAFSHDGERLWVKSRNFYKKMDEDDMWWDIALRYDLEKKLSYYPNLVFFGEVYGQVKKFRYDTVIEEGRLLTKIRFFDVWDTKMLRYLSYEDRVYKLQVAGLDSVPELYRGVWKGKDEMYPLAEGLTTLGGKHIREGWVLNTLVERYEPRLDSRMQVKLVGEGYNLAK